MAFGSVLTNIGSDGNRIFIEGPLRTKDTRSVLAAIHRTVTKAGYSDISLDFSNCTSSFSGPMLAIAAQVQTFLLDGIDTHLTLPKDDDLRRLFFNANWANLIDFRSYDPSRYRGYTQVPARKFGSGLEQHEAVQGVLNVLLGALSDFQRDHLKAIEWSINEITDNVITHSNSRVGGFLQITNFSRERQAVQYVVCDAGVGIPTSLRTSHREYRTDQEALDKAIREGVTRDQQIGQGNGLYGSWRIAQLSGGEFEIHSGYAGLISHPKSGLHVRSEKVPFNGTLVVATISYKEPLLLDEALRFRGRPHSPVDYVEVNYEEESGDRIRFLLHRESEGFGSRPAGEPVRKKLLNLARIGGGKKIIVDLGGVALVSSSFADEVFGKLVSELGIIEFMSRYELQNVDLTVRQLIDRAVRQRLAAGS